MFRLRAVPHPRVHLRRPLELPLGGRPRRADVHADHLAAGDLAPASTAYSFASTPLWAGILMLPLTLGFLIAGPISGFLSDRYGARAVRDRRDARLGARVRPASRCCRSTSPTSSSRRSCFLLGLVDGRVRLAEPRRRDEQPPGRAPRGRRRHEPDLPELGAGALDRDLLHADDPRALGDPAARARTRAQAHGVARRDGRAQVGAAAARLRALRGVPRLQPGAGAARPARPRVTSAAPTRRRSPAAASSRSLLSGPFRNGLHEAFAFAIVACLIAAAASWSRGGRYVHTDEAASPNASGNDAAMPSRAGR